MDLVAFIVGGLRFRPFWPAIVSFVLAKLGFCGEWALAHKTLCEKTDFVHTGSASLCGPSRQLTSRGLATSRVTSSLFCSCHLKQTKTMQARQRQKKKAQKEKIKGSPDPRFQIPDSGFPVVTSTFFFGFFFWLFPAFHTCGAFKGVY